MCPVDSKDNSYGEYLTNFFVMKLNMTIPDNMSVCSFRGEDLATFVHEYIHFLQNISTTFGLYSFNFVSKTTQTYISLAKNFEKDILFPDLSSMAREVENFEAEKERANVYADPQAQKKIHHIDKIEIKQEELLFDVMPSEEVPETVAIYYDCNAKNPYYFEAECIKESMAYIIEQEKFNGLSRTKTLPYNACELVCEYYYPALAKRKDILVALAELSLMHFHSGKTFIDLIQEISTKKLRLQDTDDVFRYFSHKFFCFLNTFNNEYQISQKTSIDFLYPKKAQFSDVNSWLKRTIKWGANIRILSPNFISKIMDLSNMEAKAYFFNLTKVFSVPAVCDSNYQISAPKEYKLSKALAPIALDRILTCPGNPCFVYKYCKAMKLPELSENCKTAPWLQADNDKICPFACLWYHHGLQGKGIR